MNITPSTIYTQPQPSNVNVVVNMTSDITNITNPSDTINLFWSTENAETCYATSAPINNG